MTALAIYELHFLLLNYIICSLFWWSRSKRHIRTFPLVCDVILKLWYWSITSNNQRNTINVWNMSLWVYGWKIKIKIAFCTQVLHHVRQKWDKSRTWEEETALGTNQRGEEKKRGTQEERGIAFCVVDWQIFRPNSHVFFFWSSKNYLKTFKPARDNLRWCIFQRESTCWCYFCFYFVPGWPIEGSWTSSRWFRPGEEKTWNWRSSSEYGHTLGDPCWYVSETFDCFEEFLDSCEIINWWFRHHHVVACFFGGKKKKKNMYMHVFKWNYFILIVSLLFIHLQLVQEIKPFLLKVILSLNCLFYSEKKLIVNPCFYKF